MKDIPKKARSLIEYLQAKILAGEYSENCKLPTIRELMKDFSLSNSSVKRAVDYLASLGLLETRPGAGIFVCKKGVHGAEKTKFRLAVFASAYVGVGERQGVFPAVFSGIQCAARHSAVSLILHHVYSDGFTQEQLGELSAGADAAVFLLELGHYKQNMNLKIPAIGVCMHSSPVKSMSFVDIDPFAAAEDAAVYFAGCKNPKVVVVSADYPAFMNRAKIFADYWRHYNGGECEIIVSNREDFIGFKEDCSYYFCTGTLLQQQSEIYHQRTGRFLSQDFRVLGVDGKNLINHKFHPAASIALHWEDAGQAVFDESIRRLREPGSAPRRIYLRGHLAGND